MPEAARTLVKSPPELWAEISDPEALARHLGAYGEIRITRLEPESTVAWEGDRARGTVDLAPAGWGTRVTVRAEEPEPVTVEMPEVQEPPGGLRALLARVLGRRATRSEPAPEPAPVEDRPAAAALDEMLDALGTARRRPFSRWT